MASEIGWNVSWGSPLKRAQIFCLCFPPRKGYSVETTVSYIARPVIVALSAGLLHWAGIRRQWGEDLASSESYAAGRSKLSQFCRHRVKVGGDETAQQIRPFSAT